MVSGKLWDLWVSEFKIFMRIVSLSPSLSLFLNRFTRIGNSEGSIYSISVLYLLSASTNCDRIRWSNISQDLENFQTIAPMLENLLEILKISRENRTSSISWMGGHFLNPFINESTSCRSEKSSIVLIIFPTRPRRNRNWPGSNHRPKIILSTVIFGNCSVNVVSFNEGAIEFLTDVFAILSHSYSLRRNKLRTNETPQFLTKEDGRYRL